MLKKIITAAAAAALLFAAKLTVSADEAKEPGSAGVAVIHTNDVHCGYKADDNTYGYEELAAYKAKLAGEGYSVVLVDAGDFVQGDVMGTLSGGEYIIDIMNEVGYDYVTLGNHEFDYGVDQLFKLVDKADFKALSSNFSTSGGTPEYDSYAVADADGVKIGLVGVCNPQTMKKSNPGFFKDENGEYMYDFLSGDAELFYETVQLSVNSALEKGADYVIVLSHMGIEDSDAPYRSYDLIANTTGIDVVIDAHSHAVIDGEKVGNKDGDDVLLVSAGTKMLDIGTVFLTGGGISSKLTAKGDYEVTADEDTPEYIAYARVREKIGEIEQLFMEQINEVVAATDVDLLALDPENHYDWTVRVRETNMGDLVADAYRAAVGADVGFVNGGGVRGDIFAGDITYGQMIAVQPFGNSICLVEATGQDILDALEIGARANPDPAGGFLQVSGLTLELHNYIPSPVIRDENGAFIGFDGGERRVRNVMVNGEPLDSDRIYTVASHGFLIKNGGDGNTVFTDNTLIADEAALDNQALIDYITKDLGGVIGEGYDNICGSGRITIFAEAPGTETVPAAGDASAEGSAPSKGSPDTGAEDAGAAAGIMIIAAGALIVSRKGKTRN